MARTTLAESFYSRIEQVTESGCWIWTGKVQIRTDGSEGYGRMLIPGTKVEAYAHRVSWEMHRGPLPAGMQVLHRCDVRLCVNPHHFFLGQWAENLGDAAKKGRMLKRLSPTQITEIHRRASEGERPEALAASFEVGASTIRKIRQGVGGIYRHHFAQAGH